jgi:hypothetical protein
MNPAIHNATARQHAGGPSPVLGRRGKSNDSPHGAAIAEFERELAELVKRSTHELRRAWRQLHRAEPPQGLSRDLLIRALAYDLQERTHGGASAALRRRLRNLTGASEKGALAVNPGILLTAGTTLVRQWRGQTHTILVQEDGFEHEGQRYRSLTVIAERITGAHWSGPRFFGLTKRACTSVPAQTNR